MNKRLLILLTFVIASLSITKAQITIGSRKQPPKGALLNLEQEGETRAALGLPCVEIKTSRPDLNKLAESIGGSSNIEGVWDEKQHIGLLVYNIKAPVFDPSTCKTEGVPIGLYVWEGEEWNKLGSDSKDQDSKETETTTTLTDREGNTYSIAKFGKAGIWMTENLRTTILPGLIPIDESAAISASEPYYAYPMESGAYVPYANRNTPKNWQEREGLLYNWSATMGRMVCVKIDQQQATPFGEVPGENEVESTGYIQGICPQGWHIPSDREWNELEKEISENQSDYASDYPSIGHGGAWNENYPARGIWRGQHGWLMQTSTPISTSIPGFSKNKNDGGFDVLTVGQVFDNQTIEYASGAYFWTSSAEKDCKAYYRLLRQNTNNISRFYNDTERFYSVRCKKDN